MNGLSAAELADAYTTETGRRWTQPLGSTHALFEVALDVLEHADPRNRQSVLAAIQATDLPTIAGPVSWKHGPVANVARTPLAGGSGATRTARGNSRSCPTRPHRTFR